MKRFFFSSILFLVCYSFIYTNPSVKWDASSRVYYKYKDISGYVYFEGFNFEGYEAESDGIEKMLEVTLKLLQAKYEENNQPFVFVGHSQGGLRVLAMSTYLKEV